MRDSLCRRVYCSLGNVCDRHEGHEGPCSGDARRTDSLVAKIDAARAKRRREDRQWKQALKKLEAER